MKKEDTDPKTGFKRKYHPKSRKGCATCKRRRVKCDETKPKCLNCLRMQLECAYTEVVTKRRKSKDSEPSTQQATPDKSPSPVLKPEPGLAALLSAALSSGILNAGNLNNINISQLVNNILGAGDLALLGGMANLGNLAMLAQLPIDFASISSQLLGLGMNIASLTGIPDIQAQLSALAGKPEAEAAIDSALNLNAGNAFGANGVAAPMAAAPHPASGTKSDAAPDPAKKGESGPAGDTPTPEPSKGLNMLDLRLMYHYTTHVLGTITGAGISDTDIWNHDIPMLAFEHPFLMHALLAFSATHLSRTEKGLDNCVTSHRGDALRLLREAILDINLSNTDALVASALILIMDSLANALVPSLTLPKSLPALAWIFHVKGAATILTAVWPLTEASRFYKFISVDLGDLGDIINHKSQLTDIGLLLFANLECHDSGIADLYPVPINSPYLITLAYLNKLHKERYKADFILRIFAFPALLEKDFLELLMLGDVKAMRIMRSYYKLLRSFTLEMKDKVWFLEGVLSVLPVDVEEYAGGAGGMHMMLDFLGGGPAIVEDHEVDKDLSMIDPGGRIADKLIDTNNLPSDITSTLDVMQGDSGILEMKLD